MVPKMDPKIDPIMAHSGYIWISIYIIMESVCVCACVRVCVRACVCPLLIFSVGSRTGRKLNFGIQGALNP